MTLAGHLTELRHRLLISVAAVCVMGVVCFVIYQHLLNILRRPYCEAFPGHCGLYVTGLLDGLSLRFEIAGYGGLILASPVVLWQLWRFITPGLKKTEKRYAVPFIIASIVLFCGGCCLAFISFEHALVFLKDIGGPSLHTIYSPNSYIGLILLMMAIFGITFEFPVVLVALELAGVVSSAQLLRFGRWAIVLITVAAAIFTPSGDPVSMLLLMCPLIFFYFASILIGKLLHK